MRKYQPIWEAIKKDNTVSLVAPVEKQERIIRAVRKEKVNDNVWKLLNSEQNKRYKLKETIEGSIITFSLELDTSNYIADMRL